VRDFSLANVVKATPPPSTLYAPLPSTLDAMRGYADATPWARDHAVLGTWIEAYYITSAECVPRNGAHSARFAEQF
jgi:hypothetical protein